MLNSAAPASYVGWEEEVVVSGENGRREVHYYLKRNDCGGPDLVVVGKEKIPKRMYYYGIRDKEYLLSSVKYSSLLKLRSRREVIDWLNSIVPDVSQHRFFEKLGGYMGKKGAHKLDAVVIKDVQMQTPGLHTMEFMWLGSSWICRKRLKHYLSFCRSSVKISMINGLWLTYMICMKIPEATRWLCIECIDGLATILSPEHYENVLKEATTLLSVPFVCYRLFDNDDIKPFDITRVKGYWKQEILRNMSFSSLLGTFNDNIKVEGTLSDAVGSRPKKRLRRSKECEIYLQPARKREVVDARPEDGSDGFNSSEGCKKMISLNEGCPFVSLSRQDPGKLMRTQYLTIGSQVEVLSQDSGIRGCWLRALIIRRHKDKVKVQYRDIKDATNDAKNLEEWVLASRLVVPDELGIWIRGRTVVRPVPLSDRGRVSLLVNIGSIVDAWWHDGWWEGIVVKKKLEDEIHVYFPGEKREMIFSRDDLRHSQEWIENEWKDIKAKPEVVPLLSGLRRKPRVEIASDINPNAAPYINRDLVDTIHRDALPIQNLVGRDGSMFCSDDEKKPNKVARDLSNDGFLTQLRWMSYGKRRHGRNPLHKAHYGVNSSGKYSAMGTLKRFFAPSSLKVDSENCKYAKDVLFSSSVASPVTSLVMSR